jgi:hypothetical protein
VWIIGGIPPLNFNPPHYSEEAGWAPEQVWLLLIRDELSVSAGTQPRLLGPQASTSVTLQTMLSRGPHIRYGRFKV